MHTKRKGETGFFSRNEEEYMHRLSPTDVCLFKWGEVLTLVRKAKRFYEIAICIIIIMVIVITASNQ